MTPIGPRCDSLIFCRPFFPRPARASIELALRSNPVVSIGSRLWRTITEVVSATFSASGAQIQAICRTFVETPPYLFIDRDHEIASEYRRGQIGRASCRERVCQNVELSLGDNS